MKHLIKKYRLWMWDRKNMARINAAKEIHADNEYLGIKSEYAVSFIDALMAQRRAIEESGND